MSGDVTLRALLPMDSWLQSSGYRGPVMLQAHGTKLWTTSGPAKDGHILAAWLNGN